MTRATLTRLGAIAGLSAFFATSPTLEADSSRTYSRLADVLGGRLKMVRASIKLPIVLVTMLVLFSMGSAVVAQQTKKEDREKIVGSYVKPGSKQILPNKLITKEALTDTILASKANENIQDLLRARDELYAAFRSKRITAKEWSDANLRNAIAIKIAVHDSESQTSADRLSEFEIQTLQRTFRQSEQSASSVSEKQDETAKAIIQNIKG